MSKQNREQRAERAAALVKERQRKERQRQVLSVVGVVLAMVLIIGGGFLINSLRDSSDDTAAAAPPPGSEHGLTIGESSAPHKVVVYEDFLCPFCGELEKRTHSELEQLATDGKVQVEYRPFVLLSRAGPYSQSATEAFGVTLEQSSNDVALALHDALYANQPDESGPFPSEDEIADLMTEAGASEATVQAYRDGDGEQWADDATQAAEDTGVSSTPTIILDGKPFTDGANVDQLADNLLAAVS
jgi:protein-disulfide isomerase